jgi:hypothetical protein
VRLRDESRSVRRGPSHGGLSPVVLSASSTTTVPAAFTVLTLRPGVGKGDLFFTDMSETAPRLVVADGSGGSFGPATGRSRTPTSASRGTSTVSAHMVGVLVKRVGGVRRWP